MTRAIALLLPASAAESVTPTAPAEDPALFADALVAALQSAVVQAPVPPAPVPAPPPTQEAAPQDGAEARNAGAGETLPEAPLPAASVADTTETALPLAPIPELRANPSLSIATVIVDAGPAPPVPTIPTPPSGRTSRPEMPSRAAAAETAADAASSTPEAGSHAGTSIGAAGDSPVPASESVSPGADWPVLPAASQSLGAAKPPASSAAPAPITAEMRSDAPPAGKESRVGRRTPESRADADEPTLAGKPGMQAVVPCAIAAVGVPLRLSVKAVPADGPQDDGNQAEPASTPGTTELPAAAAPSSGGAGANGARPQPPIDANRALVFAQQLSALLGEAEITDLRVRVGRRQWADEPPASAGRPGIEPRTTPDASAGTTTLTPSVDEAAVPSPSAPADRTPSSSQSPVSPAEMVSSMIDRLPDDDRPPAPGSGSAPALGDTVGGPRDPAVVMRPAPQLPTSRGAASRIGEGDANRRGSDDAGRETVRVRLAQPAPQRAAPLALPLDDAHPARSAKQSRAPILPASRQELPPSSGQQGTAVAEASTGEPSEPREPSDSPGRASIAVPMPGEFSARGEARANEVQSGEARNMPERAETKDRPAGLADRVTLQIADADGRLTRIRVMVLGNQVRAVLQPGDQESARHLERRMDDLQAALVRQGFADPKVSVQSPPTASAAAPWGAAPAGAQGEHASGRGMDQPAEDRGQGSGRQEQDRHGDGQRHPQPRFRQRDRDDRQNQDA